MGTNSGSAMKGKCKGRGWNGLEHACFAETGTGHVMSSGTIGKIQWRAILRMIVFTSIRERVDVYSTIELGPATILTVWSQSLTLSIFITVRHLKMSMESRFVAAACLQVEWEFPVRSHKKASAQLTPP